MSTKPLPVSKSQAIAGYRKALKILNDCKTLEELELHDHFLWLIRYQLKKHDPMGEVDLQVRIRTFISQFEKPPKKE